MTTSSADEHYDRHALMLLRNAGFQPSAILDIGAHRGDWARMARQVFPAAHISMIDAQDGLRPALEVAASEIGNSDVKIALLGPEIRAQASFFQMAMETTTGSSIYEEQTRFPRAVQQLPMRRLDDISAGPFQIIKLDVQGAELDVLRGAQRILISVECVVMEINLVEYNKGAPNFAEIIAAMGAYGFFMFDIFPFGRRRDGLLICVDAVLLRKGSAFTPVPPF